MPMVIASKSENEVRIELHPNRSATWQQTKLLIALMAVFVGFIALGWAMVGIWIVLPFAGLEVGLLAFLMYRVSHFTYQRQHIDIKPRRIRVMVEKRQSPIVLSREHCHVEYDDPTDNWRLPVIRLIDHRRFVEIGEFLNLDDKRKLKNTLEQAGLITCQRQWWR